MQVTLVRIGQVDGRFSYRDCINRVPNADAINTNSFNNPSGDPLGRLN